MLALVAALDARRGLGVCAELAELEGWVWTREGTLAAATRLWRALLPGIERIHQDPEAPDDLGLLLREVGAPRLKCLSIEGYLFQRPIVPAIRALCSLPALEELTLGERTSWRLLQGVHEHYHP